MAPLIERGSIVFIDVGALDHASVIDGETYAYTLWDRPDVRRVTIRKDHWTVRGYAKDSEFTDLEAQDLPSLKILGHVVGWL
ncbi:hypothetical protein A7A76_07685 [Lysobacter enzymogenes]|nr:hypothetical protein [Lysobacter enzymogenes]